MRLIDADALKEVISGNSYILRDSINSMNLGMFWDGIEQAIDDAPTVDAEPVRYAVWLTDGSIGGHCSICGEECGAIEWDNDDLLTRPTWDYCPGCGARMDGDADETD